MIHGIGIRGILVGLPAYEVAGSNQPSTTRIVSLVPFDDKHYQGMW